MSLWGASRELARYAALHYTTNMAFERVQVAVNMGVAAESLLMSCVATIDVTLLADGSSPDARLGFVRSHNTTGQFNVQELKTFSWRDASRLIQKKWSDDPALGALTATTERIMATRNSAAHITYTDPADVAESMVALLKLTKLLHPHLAMTVADYWGPEVKPIVDELDDKLTTATRQSMTVKVAAAKAEYKRIEDRFGDSLATYIETCMERPHEAFPVMDGEFQNERTVECPACGNEARTCFVGSHDGDVQAGHDPHLDRDTVNLYVWWETLLLECPVCDLQLNGAEADLLDDVEMLAGTLILTDDHPDFAKLQELADREPNLETIFMDWRDD